jgi:alkylation response protein AidB-like acyl-CoA dehydrogenase
VTATTTDADADAARVSAQLVADDAFRAEARAFLEAHATLRQGFGDATITLGATDTSQEAEDAHVARCRAWQRTLSENGWAGIAWPQDYGGRGGTIREARIFAQEESKFDASASVFAVAIQMVGPTIMAHGTDEQKAFFLSRMLHGDDIWCQLFSEPGAGSDLAGLTTRAERDGDEWIVNGQKVWTSGAQYSDYGMLLARTDSDVAKHQGITYFLLDMHTPGIDVRPLKQITGFAHFNEVFLTDVRVPNANILGPLHGGWGVAHTTLANERNMIGSGGTGITFGAILRLARECDATGDPVLRQQLAECYTRFEILKWLGLRARARAARGERLGPESSVAKLFVSQRVARDGDLVLALEGARGMLGTGDAPQNGMWQQVFLNQWGIRTGGGTEQIQRNVIGERVLGLPGDIRVDKGVPFKELPRN